MTIDEAISIMNVIVHMLEPQYDTDRVENAVEMAIKALKQQPTDAVDRVTIKEYLESFGKDTNVTATDAVDRQEAINAAIEGADKWDGGYNNEREKCIREEIAKLPSVTPQPCEDCVSRSAVLAIAGDSCLDLDSYEDTREFCDEIKELPPVTPQPKMGRWIEHFDESGKWYECDQCHTDWGGSVNYCPNCGSKM